MRAVRLTQQRVHERSLVVHEKRRETPHEGLAHNVNTVQSHQVTRQFAECLLTYLPGVGVSSADGDV